MPVPTHTQTTSDTSTGVGHLKLRGHHDAPETSAFPDLDANGVSLYPILILFCFQLFPKTDVRTFCSSP